MITKDKSVLLDSLNSDLHLLLDDILHLYKTDPMIYNSTNYLDFVLINFNAMGDLFKDQVHDMINSSIKKEPYKNNIVDIFKKE